MFSCEPGREKQIITINPLTPLVTLPYFCTTSVDDHVRFPFAYHRYHLSRQLSLDSSEVGHQRRQFHTYILLHVEGSAGLNGSLLHSFTRKGHAHKKFTTACPPINCAVPMYDGVASLHIQQPALEPKPSPLHSRIPLPCTPSPPLGLDPRPHLPNHITQSQQNRYIEAAHPRVEPTLREPHPHPTPTLLGQVLGQGNNEVVDNSARLGPALGSRMAT